MIFDDISKKYSVEIKKNQDILVIRSDQSSNVTDDIVHCNSKLDEFLDIMSVKYSMHRKIIDRKIEYQYFSLNEYERCLTIFSTTQFGMSTNQGIFKNEQWLPALRFYRLSQMCSDLLEAYRFLFLALESIISSHVVKNRGETETAWLIRSINFLSMQFRVDVRARFPKYSDYGTIIDHIYKIRKRIFHSKPSISILQFEIQNYGDVQEAFEIMLLIWQQILETKHGIRTISNGLAHEGFDLLVPATLGNLGIAVTEDISSISRSQTEISPLGMAVDYPPSAAQISKISGGEFHLKHIVARDQIKSSNTIGRFCLLSAEKAVAIIGVLPQPLHLGDVNRIEFITSIRLRNPTMPKEEFL